MLDNEFCVLVVDDEVRMTKALKDFFKAKKFHVLSANNGEEALDLYYSNNEIIDIILLDVMMPVLDGYAVLEELRLNNDNIPIIMLTAKSEEVDQLQGFKYGADDYVTKPFSPLLLLARVESVLKRVNKNFDKEISIEGINVNLNNYEVCVNDVKLELTRREFDLLYYLLVNKNIALSREKILNGVWGYDFEGDLRTVDTHIKQLRIKLAEKAVLIKTIHRVGYIFEVK